MKVAKVTEQAQPLSRVQQVYDRVSMIPIYVAALVWLVSAIFQIAPGLRPEYSHLGAKLSWWVTGVFVLDLVIRFLIDPHKRNFLRRTWFLIVCIIVPVLRVVLVLNAIKGIRRDRNAITKMVFLYAIFGVMFVIAVGAAIVLAVEIDGDGSIHSYGDAMWWSLETVTTVGYGDFTPVTVVGRLMAAIIMFSGAAAVGALTAAVASRFIKGGGPDAGTNPTDVPSAPSDTSATSDDLHAAIAGLSQRIDALTRRLDGEGE